MRTLVDDRTHVKNLKKAAKQTQATINAGICPKCGGQLIKRNLFDLQRIPTSHGAGLKRVLIGNEETDSKIKKRTSPRKACSHCILHAPPSKPSHRVNNLIVNSYE